MVGPWFRRRFRSIRARLTALLIGFLFLTLGTMGLVLDGYHTSTLVEQVEERERFYVRNIQQSIERVLFAGKYQVQGYIESLAARDHHLRYVIVIDRQTRQAIAHSDPTRVGALFDDPITRQGFNALVDDRSVIQSLTLPGGEPVRDLAVPFERGFLNEPAGIIRVGISTAEQHAIIRQSRLYALSLILLFLGLGALLSIALTVRMTSGLNMLMSAVRRFGEGDYTAHVPVPPVPEAPFDELEQVGQAFNQMAARLQGYAESLETEVKERTTQLVHLYENLQASEERLRTVVTNAPVNLFALDKAGRLTLEVGRGLGPQEGNPGTRIGQRVTDLYPGVPEVGAYIERALAGEALSATMEVAGRTVEVWYTPMRGAQGVITGVIGVALDVTERRRLEEQLRMQFERLKELDQLKTNFVNAVTHEIRTPLTSIMGYAEFLEDELGGPLTAQQRDFVAQLVRGARRLEFLVNDLLDFARLEAGTFQLRCEMADLNAKIREATDSLRPQLDEAHLVLTLDLAEEPLMVPMDAQRIGQVLINLVGNAIKFTPAGGRIWVRARVAGSEVLCQVQDTGPGIAPEDQAKLFQRFTQLEAGLQKGKGAGLGLSISKALVDAHGGRIGVDSLPGSGSTFWFSLPLESSRLAPAPQSGPISGA